MSKYTPSKIIHKRKEGRKETNKDWTKQLIKSIKFVAPTIPIPPFP
jgi:hypothetical protein